MPIKNTWTLFWISGRTSQNSGTKNLTEKSVEIISFYLCLLILFAFREPKSDIVQEKWLPVSTDNLEYFHMGKGEVKMEVDLLPERSRFWRSITSEKNSHASKDEL